jgi:hypothetical protein
MPAVLRVNAATEPPIGLDAEMLARPIATGFGARRATGLNDAVGQLADQLQLFQIEAHQSGCRA